MPVFESKSHKVVKRNREKKLSKVLDEEVILQAIENGQESPNEAETKRSEKKPQGIVIDGKTYTCATCKAGHRVGVCKHGRERPMKATHPPGRPPAGAPKKVVCDCPKSCSCAKKDCKCARRCHCTQAMYMLVYIPAPDEDEDNEDEKGQWKLGEQVMTDLKGNILTPEQVRERKQKKEALKILEPHDSRSRSGPIAPNQSIVSSPTPTDVSQSGVSSCCKHKENVSHRSSVVQTPVVAGEVSNPPAAADGCNCGHACNCAFCPQHPNNSTSLNAARQQAMHFANHPSMDNQSIVPFLPTLPQNISCMGGQPRFAMSKHAGRPSFRQLQTIFPNPGYVIGYPVWPLRTETANFNMQSFDNSQEQPYVDAIPMATSRTASVSYPTIDVGSSNASQNFPFAHEEYGIGDAFVASAGVEGWDNDGFHNGGWHFHDGATAMATPFDHLTGRSDSTTSFQPIAPDLETILSPVASLHTAPQSEALGYIQPMPITLDNTISTPSDAFPISSCCQTTEKPASPFDADRFSPSMANDGQTRYGGLA